MKKTYNHISAEERAVIMLEHAKNTSARQLGRILNRAPSTITRELKRNRDESSMCYDATSAGRLYGTRRQRCVRSHKLNAGSELYQYAHDRLVY